MTRPRWLDIPQAEPPEPTDSALGILVRRGAGGKREVLFARRHPTSRFMPGHLAFPGGRMDAADEPARDGAWARCASREVDEEVGVRVEPRDWLDVGERTTPPMFPLRFRTRFFLGAFPEGAELPAEPPRPEEIDRLRFAAPDDVLREWATGRSLLPPPCLPLLRTFEAHPELPFAGLAERLREANALEERLPRIEFEPGIWVLPVLTRTIPPATHTNVWMPGGRSFVVVDPGSDRPGEIERLLGVVRRRRDLGKSMVAVLLTHHHPDHVGGVAALAETLGVPVRAHQATLERLQLPAAVESAPLAEGDLLDLDGLALRALHTPGHAPGHLAFELVGRGLLIAGDLLSGFSTILVLPPEGVMETYLASLARVRDAGYRRLLPAHGPPLPGRSAARVIEHRRRRESLVVGELRAEARSLETIARGAYREAPELPGWLIEGQALAHLLDLERRAEAKREDDDGRSWKRGKVRPAE